MSVMPLRPGLGVVLVPLLGSCAAVTTFDPSPPAGPLRVAGTDLRDWKGIVHCHGRLSHDSDGTEAEIHAACVDCGVDFVVMTDHQTDASVRDGLRGVRGGVLFLVGAEVRTPQGTLLAFPLIRPLRRWQHAALLANEAADQGALSFVCHAEAWRSPWSVAPVAGAEIVNLHAGALARSYAGTLATALLLPLRDLMTHVCVRDAKVIDEWDRQLASGRQCVPVGGDDAHANVRLFGPLGGTLGTYREVFATLSTHVLAQRLCEADLVDAIRRGRTYVSFDIFGEGSGFDFRAEHCDEVVLVGSEVVGGPSTRLCVTVPKTARVRLFRDACVVAEEEARRIEYEAPLPGVYRVEATTLSGEPWLFSSTIRVL